MIMGGASSMERGSVRLATQAASVDSRTSIVRVCNGLTEGQHRQYADREVTYIPNTPENDTPAE